MNSYIVLAHSLHEAHVGRADLAPVEWQIHTGDDARESALTKAASWKYIYHSVQVREISNDRVLP